MHDARKAPTDGPAMRLRFRTKTEKAKIERAARIENLSLNTFIVSRAAVAAEILIERHTVQQAALAHSDAVPTEAGTNGQGA